MSVVPFLPSYASASAAGPAPAATSIAAALRVQKAVALAKGIGRVTEASLSQGRPPRNWWEIPVRRNAQKLRRCCDTGATGDYVLSCCVMLCFAAPPRRIDGFTAVLLFAIVAHAHYCDFRCLT
eukprot:5258841-Pleurochrysis_carterae.AAC.2